MFKILRRLFHFNHSVKPTDKPPTHKKNFITRIWNKVFGKSEHTDPYTTPKRQRKAKKDGRPLSIKIGGHDVPFGTPAKQNGTCVAAGNVSPAVIQELKLTQEERVCGEIFSTHEHFCFMLKVILGVYGKILHVDFDKKDKKDKKPLDSINMNKRIQLMEQFLKKQKCYGDKPSREELRYYAVHLVDYFDNVCELEQHSSDFLQKMPIDSMEMSTASLLQTLEEVDWSAYHKVQLNYRKLLDAMEASNLSKNKKSVSRALADLVNSKLVDKKGNIIKSDLLGFDQYAIVPTQRFVKIKLLLNEIRKTAQRDQDLEILGRVEAKVNSNLEIVQLMEKHYTTNKEFIVKIEEGITYIKSTINPLEADKAYTLKHIVTLLESMKKDLNDIDDFKGEELRDNLVAIIKSSQAIKGMLEDEDFSALVENLAEIEKSLQNYINDLMENTPESDDWASLSDLMSSTIFTVEGKGKEKENV